MSSYQPKSVFSTLKTFWSTPPKQSTQDTSTESVCTHDATGAIQGPQDRAQKPQTSEFQSHHGGQTHTFRKTSRAEMPPWLPEKSDRLQTTRHKQYEPAAMQNRRNKKDVNEAEELKSEMQAMEQRNKEYRSELKEWDRLAEYLLDLNPRRQNPRLPSPGECIAAFNRFREDYRAINSRASDLERELTEAKQKIIAAEQDSKIFMSEVADREAIITKHEEQILWQSKRFAQVKEIAIQFQNQMSHEKQKVDALQSQVMALKKDFAATNQVQNTVSDAAIGQKLEDLCHEIFDWTFDAFSDAVFEKVPTSHERQKPLSDLAVHRSCTGELTPSILLQGVVWRTMVIVFRAQYCFGNSPNGMVGGAATLAGCLDAKDYVDQKEKQWMRTTLDILRSHAEGDMNHAIEKFKEDVAAHLESDIARLVRSRISGAQRTGLLCIIEKAVKLATIIWQQDDAYKIDLPFPLDVHKSNIEFEPGSMTSADWNQEDKCLMGKKVDCYITPCLLKRAEQKSNDTPMDIVIRKAKVLCIESKHEHSDETEIQIESP